MDNDTLAKKRFLFKKDRLRAFLSPVWENEAQPSNAVVKMKDCSAMMRFVEQMVCLQGGLQEMDAPFLANCLRTLCVWPKTENPTEAASDGQQIQPHAVVSKSRLAEVFSQAGLQARCAELAAKFDAEELTAVIVSIAQIWSFCGPQAGKISTTLFNSLSWQLTRSDVLEACSASTLGELARAYESVASEIPAQVSCYPLSLHRILHLTCTHIPGR